MIRKFETQDLGAVMQIWLHGNLYVTDERFRENIDKAGGEGTAAFVSKAIAAYCGA